MTDRTNPMTTDAMLKLAERCEQAAADDQRDLLNEAFHEIHGESAVATDWTSNHIAKRFAAMIRAEAYESAAMTLAPEGHDVRLWWGKRGGKILATSEINNDFSSLAETPALALCAAALKARASQ